MTTYHPDATQGTPNGEGTQTLADTAREQFEARRTQVSKAAENTRKQIADASQNATHQTAQFVRDNPAVALAGAVGAGILLGLALRGRG